MSHFRVTVNGVLAVHNELQPRDIGDMFCSRGRKAYFGWDFGGQYWQRIVGLSVSTWAVHVDYSRTVRSTRRFTTGHQGKLPVLCLGSI